jgi:hypothetical protein
MSANLRRVLDTTHLSERRRLGELLQQIRQAALTVRAQPPTEDGFFHVEVFPQVFASMTRPLWQAPDFVASDKAVEVEGNELGLDELRRFRNLPQIRLQELTRNVEACLVRDHTVTLQQVLNHFPPRNGIMEVVGYMLVASNGLHHLIDDRCEVIRLPPPCNERWRVPCVSFYRE